MDDLAELLKLYENGFSPEGFERAQQVIANSSNPYQSGRVWEEGINYGAEFFDQKEFEPFIRGQRVFGIGHGMMGDKTAETMLRRGAEFYLGVDISKYACENSRQRWRWLVNEGKAPDRAEFILDDPVHVMDQLDPPWLTASYNVIGPDIIHNDLYLIELAKAICRMTPENGYAIHGGLDHPVYVARFRDAGLERVKLGILFQKVRRA